jgi:hypothetical protein
MDVGLLFVANTQSPELIKSSESPQRNQTMRNLRVRRQHGSRQLQDRPRNLTNWQNCSSPVSSPLSGEGMGAGEQQ